MSKKFDKKVVIVTGSSSGIGQAVLLGFAKKGASVVLHGTNKGRIDETEDLLRKLNIPDSKYLVFHGEIQHDAVQEELIERTIAKFGKIDVLINNAGVAGHNKMSMSSTEFLDYVFGINFRAAHRLAELAIPYLQKTKGNIINTSSIAAVTKPMNMPNYPIYGASKAALDTWVKFDSQRLAKLGIRINNISPGPFKTHVGDKMMPEDMTKEERKQMNDDFDKLLKSVSSFGRYGKMDELVPAYLLLADNKASAFTTGACWTIDGGAAYCGQDWVV